MKNFKFLLFGVSITATVLVVPSYAASSLKQNAKPPLDTRPATAQESQSYRCSGVDSRLGLPLLLTTVCSTVDGCTSVINGSGPKINIFNYCVAAGECVRRVDLLNPTFPYSSGGPLYGFNRRWLGTTHPAACPGFTNNGGYGTCAADWEKCDQKDVLPTPIPELKPRIFTRPATPADLWALKCSSKDSAQHPLLLTQVCSTVDGCTSSVATFGPEQNVSLYCVAAGECVRRVDQLNPVRKPLRAPLYSFNRSWKGTDNPAKCKDFRNNGGYGTCANDWNKCDQKDVLHTPISF